MLKLALIGEGIAESQSPDLHQRLGNNVGIPVQYDLVDALHVTDFDFLRTLDNLRAQGYRGTNVTYPFKELACQAADEHSQGVKKVGTANTLLFENDKILADNTDYSGFISAYRQHFGSKPAGAILLIGAGGVGRAIACALGELEVTQIHVLEPDPQRAQALCDDLNALGISARVMEASQVSDHLSNLQGIVNCSPVGHLNHPGCPIPTDGLNSTHWVFDAVYIPAKTRLLAAAEQGGASILTGVELFVFQGVDAFRRFVGTDVSTAAIDGQVMDLFQHYYQQLVSGSN